MGADFSEGEIKMNEKGSVRKVRGTGADIIIIDEAAHIDPLLHFNSLIPILKQTFGLDFFLEILKEEGITDPITKENINKDFKHQLPFGNSRFIELATRDNMYHVSVVLFLLSLGAEITHQSFLHSCDPISKILLEHGFVPTASILKQWVRDDRDTDLLIDYGAKIDPYWNPLGGPPLQLTFYSGVSNQRVSLCRQSEKALLVFCRIGPFAALRRMVQEFAKQMWRMRGAEGCGPRGHGWVAPDDESQIKTIVETMFSSSIEPKNKEVV